MINLKVLTTEDFLTIMEMGNEIKAAADKVTAEKLLNLLDINVGLEALFSDKKIRYAFTSNNEVGVAAYCFFGNIYTAKRLARNTYVYDEGETFVESIDCEFPLGHVKLPNDAVIETSTVEFVMKARKFNDRNKKTGFPFDIVEIRLINPDA